MGGEPLAFQKLLDFETEFRKLPPVAKAYYIEHVDTMPDDEFWEFYEWLTTPKQQAIPDPYGWDPDELEGIL
jgi:hypothetical protein